MSRPIIRSSLAYRISLIFLVCFPSIATGAQLVPECIKRYPGQALSGATEYQQISVPPNQDCIQICLEDGPQCQGVVHTRYPDGRHTCTLYAKNSQAPDSNIVTPQSIRGETYSLYEIPRGCQGQGPQPAIVPHSFPGAPPIQPGVYPSVVQPSSQSGHYPALNSAPWSACSVTCGNGIQTRQRDCFNCPGPLQERQDCYLGPCAKWNDWAKWSACSVTCGSGQTTRSRACSHGFGQCPGQATQRQICNKPPCPSWSPWHDWSSCSSSCGSGTSSRSRTCHGERNGCPGSSVQQRECTDLPDCPTWTPWTQWSQCSRTCDGGTRYRGRTCQSIGLCHGPSSEEVQCNGQPCPQWTLWAPWSHCSASCNGGVRLRSRSCSYGGSCFGTRTESTRCNINRCPTWSQWAPWSSCSKSCGEGQTTRNRSCRGGGFCHGGNGVQSKGCNIMPCATWSAWNPWNECSVTCGVGVRQRIRGCTRGAGCPSGSETDQESCQLPDCQPATDPPIEHFVPEPQPPKIYFPSTSACEYQPWGRWTECSRSCGTGFESRNRYCPCNSCAQHGQPQETRTCTDRVGLVLPPCPGFYNPRYRPFYIERNLEHSKKKKSKS